MNPFRVTLAALLVLAAPVLAQAQSRPQQQGQGRGGEKSALSEEPVAVVAMPIVEAAGKNTSLLRVNVTYQAWNFRVPWQKTSPGTRRGLGVLMEKNQILVTAQIVADATYIELEQADTGQKLTAKVKAVDYDANLAVLEPASDPKEFFSALKPLAIETSGRIGDKLQVWQLGRVGDLIITPLEINKVLTSRYVLDTSHFLVYETIGIIRSESNSFTLPVIKNGKLAGLLLRYNSRDQTATVLPGPIIAHFLKDIASGDYKGFPSLGVEYQQTLDEQFREYLGMTKDQQGVYIGEVAKGGSAESLGMKKGDILMEMNGYKVDARGDYKDPVFGPVNLSHLVRGNSYVGDKVSVKVLRDGKEQTLSGKLTRKNPKDYVVWPYLFDRGANFLVMGGLVFQELSIPYLQSFGENWETSGPLRLVHIASHADEYEKMGKKKIIFLSGALPTRSTQGYGRIGGSIVSKVNGKEINDLSDLDKAFKEPQNLLHTIELEDFPKIIYLDAIAAESDNLKLMDVPYRVGTLKRIE
ncbi:S1C family serine protease [Roseimicrobium sp. ORNL1]|uniref:S1C family serine protease n=1 Tax=Roseimicrobium sp. ORNL1 TaxID=2711231 RepID=UPI0013E11DC6|nr:S1C family serine protease [Roseimicrobium sp. ORNL1]QIF05628.1 PDZ domain-containing protein [Roseimicrobium sp. ORNL1]